MFYKWNPAKNKALCPPGLHPSLIPKPCDHTYEYLEGFKSYPGGEGEMAFHSTTQEPAGFEACFLALWGGLLKKRKFSFGLKELPGLVRLPPHDIYICGI